MTRHTLRSSIWPLALPLAALGLYHLSRLRSDDSRAEEARARARVGPRPAEPPPSVSILVAAWNERDSIEPHVRSVLALRSPGLQYVLCAGGSDGTYDAAAALVGGRGVVLRQEPGEGKQRALRRCLRHAEGEIVYLTDADCVLDQVDFDRIVAAVGDKFPAATGRSRPLQSELAERPEVLCLWAPQYVAESAFGETSRGLLGRNCAVRRDALDRAGAFDADVATGTDYHLARSLVMSGSTIGWVGSSFVESRFSPDLASYTRQQSRWLRNHWIHAAATGERALQLHAARSWLAGLATMLLPLAAPLLGRPAALAWLLLVAQGVLARLRYVRFVVRAERLPWRWSLLAWAPLSFFVDAFAWARSFVDFVSPGQRHRW
jgi:cellulose synthase/poly-beta-1,6-N-acetylglucosamine synthase-like glycosyltransferase